MRPIYGNDCLVSLRIDGVFYPILCAISMVLNVRRESVLATSATTGAWRKKKPRGLGDWDVSLNGLTKVDNTDGQISWFYFLQNIDAEHFLQLLFEDDEGNQKVIEGKALLTQQSITGSVGDFANGTLAFEGSEGFATDAETAPPVSDGVCEVQTTLEVILPAGATSVTVGALTAPHAEVLWITREGGGLRSQEITTPGNREYKVNYLTGLVQFDPANPANPGGEEIEIGWQIKFA